MLTLNLKYIDHVNFQKSELRNFEELVARRRVRLGENEVAALVSLSGDQVVFVYGFSEVQNGATRRVLRSQRWRISGAGKWDPRMLANYAEEVGIRLNGIQRFEHHYERLQKDRLERTRLRRSERTE